MTNRRFHALRGYHEAEKQLLDVFDSKGEFDTVKGVDEELARATVEKLNDPVFELNIKPTDEVPFKVVNTLTGYSRRFLTYTEAVSQMDELKAAYYIHQYVKMLEAMNG